VLNDSTGTGGRLHCGIFDPAHVVLKNDNTLSERYCPGITSSATFR